MRIIREHAQWWIIREIRIFIPGGSVLGMPRESVVGNVDGPYEDALAEFFRLRNNYRCIREKYSRELEQKYGFTVDIRAIYPDY